jgi:hypothetical protein
MARPLFGFLYFALHDATVLDFLKETMNKENEFDCRQDGLRRGAGVRVSGPGFCGNRQFEHKDTSRQRGAPEAERVRHERRRSEQVSQRRWLKPTAFF